MRSEVLGCAALGVLAIGCGPRVDATTSNGTGTTSSNPGTTASQTTRAATTTSSSTSGADATSSGDVESGSSGTTGPGSCYPGVGAGEVVWRVGIEGRVRDVVINPVGWAVLAGFISGDQEDWWVAAYDPDGGLLWEDSDVGPLDQAATVAMLAPTNTYVSVGYDLIDQIPESSEQRVESWMREYSVDGAKKWELQFSHDDYWVSEVPIALGEDADGHRVLVTERREGAVYNYVGALRRITATGQVISETDVAWDDDDPGTAPHARGGQLVPTNPSEVIVVGTYSPDRWAVRVNQAGEIIWSQRWSCDSPCGLRHISATPDGDFIITGVEPDREGTDDPWIASLGGDGALNWQTSWGTPGLREGILAMTVAADGTIVVVGKTNVTSGQMAHEDGWVRKLSPSGEFLWQTSLNSEMDAGAVTLSAVATGGDCGGIWVAGSESGQGFFLALLAP